MGFFDQLGGRVKDLFTSPATFERARQVAFHLKAAEPLRDAAMVGRDERAWTAYVDVLGRALAVDPDNFEARWMRALAGLHRFRTYPPPALDPDGIRLATTWNEDLKWLLTQFPDPEPPGTSLAQARDMRAQFDRLCRNYKVG